MEKCFSPEPLIDQVVTAHQVQKLGVGSLWWVSEEIWRSAGKTLGKFWRNSKGKPSHPGAIVRTTLGLDLPFFILAAGSTTKSSFPAQQEVFVEMRPISHPLWLTKFGGAEGFIGQYSGEDLVECVCNSMPPSPYLGRWLHPNDQLPQLDEDDLAELQELAM